MRAPLAIPKRGVRVRDAVASDATALAELSAMSTRSWRLTPPELFPWPDPAGRHHGWIAEDPCGRPLAGLVVLDAAGLRRIQIAQYGLRDLPLRIAMAALSCVGAAVPLPPRRRAYDVGRPMDRSDAGSGRSAASFMRRLAPPFVRGSMSFKLTHRSETRCPRRCPSCRGPLSGPRSSASA